jgi:signal transduction histidine kinase
MRDIIKRPVIRLAASYLAIIMIMSIGFSIVFYMTSARELDRRPAPDYYSNYSRDFDHDIDQWLQERAESGRMNLAINLALVNALTLLLGAVLSYFLAQKTLEPIEAAMRAQDRFIADASHELRTPLTGLLLNNEVTLRKKKLSVSDARLAMERNVDELTQLKNLSDTLLDLAAREKSHVPVKKTHSMHIVDAALTQILPLADARGIRIVKDVTDSIVTTNESHLIKTLVILCDNAVKYSKPSTIITVASKVQGDELVFTVKDEGMGMSEDEKAHIFDRLYRADTSRSTVPGYGLGLAIAHKLVHEINGTIAVESAPKKGSMFTVRIPYSA